MGFGAGIFEDAGDIFGGIAQTATDRLGDSLTPGFDPILGNPLTGADPIITPTGNFTAGTWQELADNGVPQGFLFAWQETNKVADVVAPAIVGASFLMPAGGLTSIGAEAGGTGITLGSGAASIGEGALGSGLTLGGSTIGASMEGALGSGLTVSSALGSGVGAYTGLTAGALSSASLFDTVKTGYQYVSTAQKISNIFNPPKLPTMGAPVMRTASPFLGYGDYQPAAQSINYNPLASLTGGEDSQNWLPILLLVGVAVATMR